MNTRTLEIKKQVKLVTATAIHVIPVDTIVYCEKCFKGTVFYQMNDQQLFVDMPFHEVENIMKSFSFWLASQSIMINLDFLDEVPIADEKPLIKLEKYKLPVDKERINLLVEVLKIIG